MQGNLSIKGVTVQNIYAQYLSGNFVINRRYQRKLVWSVEEKEKFIDSLLNSFPIPMIITAIYKKADDSNASEILDGMQRLNAITAFIEGEFPVNGKYFNLSAVAQTKRKLDAGKLKQNNPYLDLDSCSKILDYPVPFSVCDTNEPKKVDESFRRINTGGRTLSRQDVRQAGSLGMIPDLVRDAAIYIRKDASRTSILDLSNMKNISLSNRGLSYGIDLQNIFWVRHSIITSENVRKSRDEELVAHLLAYIAFRDGAKTPSTYLDAIYNADSDESKELQRKINTLGFETVYRQFCFVFDELEKVLDSCDNNFSKLVYSGRPTKVNRVFQVVYIAFYKAIIQSNLKVGNYKNLCGALKYAFDKHLKAVDSDKKWTSQDREKLSDALFGVIKPHFAQRSGTDRNLSSWVESLENILNESQTEQVCYDFKMGLNKISDGSGEFLPKTLSKIVKTLVAMTNTKVGDCYIILGVADKELDAKTHEKHYKKPYLTYGNFNIVGIDSEAASYHGSLDKYERKILDHIDKEPISPYFRHVVKSNLVTFTYADKEVLLFKAYRGEKPELYDNTYVKRALSHNESVARDEEFDFFEFFKNESLLAQKI
ncbi:GmrSD restriction endonuclease domain-containing protein [Vibrio vulnificus]|uniref:GmrSD restriction endonuclease domain-containing protein n=1 Tax=Vibrio vulnificus TaxID=672 RepID=UPI004058E823